MSLVRLTIILYSVIACYCTFNIQLYKVYSTHRMQIVHCTLMRRFWTRNKTILTHSHGEEGFLDLSLSLVKCCSVKQPVCPPCSNTTLQNFNPATSIMVYNFM